MGPDVAIVVVTHNSAPMIGGLLASIPAALDGLSAEVIIIDNGSSDDTIDLVRARGGCQVIAEENRGYAAGINAGIRRSSAWVPVVVLNPDVRLAAGAIRAMVDRLGGAVGIVAPTILTEAGELQRSLRREPTLPRALGLSGLGLATLDEYVLDDSSYLKPHAVDWALGAVLALSRDCLDGVGEWDESYFLYSEETDYCLRARDRGIETWYEPAATAVHVGGQSGQSDELHTMQILNRVRFYARRHHPVKGYLYLFLALLSEASWVVRGHRKSRAAIRALLTPGVRPRQLGLDGRLLPR